MSNIENPVATPEARAEFEDSIYKLFFIKSVRKRQDSPWLASTNVPKAEFCKRHATRTDTTGEFDYDDETLSAIWAGWKLARGWRV